MTAGLAIVESARHGREEGLTGAILPGSRDPAVDASVAASTVATTAPDRSGLVGAWRKQLTEAVAVSGTVVADTGRALAAQLGQGRWLLVNTSTDAAVEVAEPGVVIGVGDTSNGFAFVATTDSATRVVVRWADARGAVADLATVPVPVSVDGSPPRFASIATYASTVGVLVVTTAPSGQAGTVASIAQGQVQVLPVTIAGRLTFTNDGSAVVTGFAAASDQRRVFDRQVGLWSDASLNATGFVHTSIVLGITTDAALAFDSADPTRLAVVHGDGSITGSFVAGDEARGWVLIADPGNDKAVLVGMSSGQTLLIDRATGSIAAGQVAGFTIRAGEIVTAWTTPEGEHQALVTTGAGCVVDGLPTVGGCHDVTIVDSTR